VTTKPKWTGLGLAIVKKIVEEHGGMIAAENTADGASVVIRLPLESPEGKTGWESGALRDAAMGSQERRNGVVQRGEIA
jgi:hypothetical protein